MSWSQSVYIRMSAPRNNSCAKYRTLFFFPFPFEMFREGEHLTSKWKFAVNIYEYVTEAASWNYFEKMCGTWKCKAISGYIYFFSKDKKERQTDKPMLLKPIFPIIIFSFILTNWSQTYKCKGEYEWLQIHRILKYCMYGHIQAHTHARTRWHTLCVDTVLNWWVPRSCSPA